ncbi:hypothetical protein GCM10010276_22710 [Streptomyces longisporus]|uniref:Uncharacterized protein n=1 Tax=Streptomyces longisporus TaxID=1948 RepID=A0ABN3LK27_STRLO
MYGTEALDDPIRRVGHRRTINDVNLQEFGRRSDTEDRASLIEVIGAQIRYGDADAMSEEGLHDPQANPTRTTGYKCHFVRQISHVALLVAMALEAAPTLDLD